MKKYALLIFLYLAVGFAFLSAENTFAQSLSDKTSSPVTGITAGRARSIVGGIIALVSLIIGWRARARSRSSGPAASRTQAIIALSLSGIAIVLSSIHLSSSAGAVFGSGSGKAGAIVALVLALLGAGLSGQALRSKRRN